MKNEKLKIESLACQSQSLKRWREKSKLSLREVSEKTGIELTRLSRVEAGKYMASAAEICLLEECYDIYAGHLFLEVTYPAAIWEGK